MAMPVQVATSEDSPKPSQTHHATRRGNVVPASGHEHHGNWNFVQDKTHDEALINHVNAVGSSAKIMHLGEDGVHSFKS